MHNYLLMNKNYLLPNGASSLSTLHQFSYDTNEMMSDA